MTSVADDARLIANRVWDDITIGESASHARTLTQQDIDLFALVSGDVNPSHLDPGFATTDMFHTIIAHGMWGAGLISAVLGTKLPGPGTIYVSQSLRFLAPVAVGDTVTTRVVVREKRPHDHLSLDCRCVNQHGVVVIEGEAEVLAPTVRIARPATLLPDVRLMRHPEFNRLLAAARGLKPVRAAIAHPCDATALEAAADMVRAGLIEPVLVGPAKKIHAVAEAAGVIIDGWRLEDVPHSHAAAARAVALVRAREADILVKGSLHTDEVMHAVLAADTGLRTERRLSHVYIMDVPAYPRPLLITDAAVAIKPDLAEKRDIVQNAIDLAHTLGIAVPKVAVLAAVETVNDAMPATLDAAALCKMADRGQISGGMVDGPLAFDNAIDAGAAAQKGIKSAVAGFADILVVPDLEAGNMLAKQLVFLAGADAAGIVLGATVPIVLTSRADSRRTRVASAAVAVVMARARMPVAAA